MREGCCIFATLNRKRNKRKRYVGYEKNKNSITGVYLAGREYIPIPSKRRKGNGNYIKIKGASCNNLKKVNVDIPLGCFVAITGVSGSGKSSLINQTGVSVHSLKSFRK